MSQEMPKSIEFYEAAAQVFRKTLEGAKRTR